MNFTSLRALRASLAPRTSGGASLVPRTRGEHPWHLEQDGDIPGTPNKTGATETDLNVVRRRTPPLRNTSSHTSLVHRDSVVPLDLVPEPPTRLDVRTRTFKNDERGSPASLLTSLPYPQDLGLLGRPLPPGRRRPRPPPPRGLDVRSPTDVVPWAGPREDGRTGGRLPVNTSVQTEQVSDTCNCTLLRILKNEEYSCVGVNTRFLC